MTTRIVHVKDNVPGAIYIGRAVPRRKLKASPFANPHRINGERQLCIDKFENDIVQGPLRPLLAQLPDLRGKPLACWCRHDGEPWTAAAWCHGDVLCALLDNYTDDELRALGNPDLRVCRVCGCSDEWGCAEGCYWVEEDLCSSCIDDGEAQ